MKSLQYTLRHLLGIILFIYSSASMADNAGAIAVVEKLHAALISAMQNADKLGFQGRYDALAPVIESSFDTPLIVEVILSHYWKELNEGQQKKFIAMFNRLSISTYASRFDAYSGETFKTLGVEELKKGRLLIKTELDKKDDEPIKLDYMVHQNEGKWYIISVIANGVNDVALKRAEYATIINDRGFDNLVNEIETKIKDLSTTPGT